MPLAGTIYGCVHIDFMLLSFVCGCDLIWKQDKLTRKKGVQFVGWFYVLTRRSFSTACCSSEL